MSEKNEDMKSIWRDMSADEKREMMKTMMESFFSDMKGDDKHKFMYDMMGAGDGEKGFNPMKMMGMMSKMMGGRRHKNGRGRRGRKMGCSPMEMMEDGDSKEGFNPMKMMHKMMGGDEKAEGFNMMETCGRVMSMMHENHKISTLATPEVQGLFEDWAEQIEAEVLESIKDKKDVDIAETAARFKISKDSAYYFLTRLAQKGKINLKIDKEEE